MGGCPSNIDQESLQIFLVLERVLVVVGHLGEADYLAALLEEDGNANVFGKGE
jgi:hypothetical protein